jgi:hypothetical protein
LPGGVLYLLAAMASGAVPRGCSGLCTTSSRGLGARGLACGLLICAAGCGGAAPLLHPAQTLPVGAVSAGAGVSGQFGSPDVTDSIDRGRAAAGQPLDADENATAYASGVLTDALLSPGATPWVAARVGVTDDVEAGLSYTGRSLRVDGRYALELDESWTLSLGLGLTGLLLTPERGDPRFGEAAPAQDNPQVEFEPSARGWGADLPVLIGYRLLENFGDVWLGPRLGFERLSGDLRLERDDPASLPIDLSANRLWAGLVAGFSLGIPPLWLRFELATTYHRLRGSLEPTQAGSSLEFGSLEASGWSFSPSGGIVGKF